MAGTDHPHSASGGHHDPAMFALRTRKNHEQMLVFLICMTILAMVFIFFQWLRRVGPPPAVPSSGKAPLPTVISRNVRKLLLRNVPFLPSMGHGTLVAIYLLINMCITFTNTDPALTITSNLGSRMGWMAIANLMVVIFLALKNTPLAVLSAWSYERLNIFHQVSGILTVLYVIAHAILYTYTFTSIGMTQRLLELKEVWGMIAGASFFMLGVGGVLIRRWWYEAFYYMHIIFWVLGVVTTALHQPEPSKKIIWIVIAAAVMWVADRLIRVVRLTIHGVNNEVVVTPLGHGATRVTVKKAPTGAASGKHCFLWIPRVRLTEMHPFTIVATEPLEFVVSSHNGFTSSLHNYAQQNPGASLKASLEGPYGTFPDAKNFNKVVLVAGGTGATFTFGVALGLLQKMAADEIKEVLFIWTVKQKSCLTWFADYLNMLRDDSRFKVKLYVTRESTALQQITSWETTTPSRALVVSKAGDVEMKAIKAPNQPARSLSMTSGMDSASESELASPIEGIDASIRSVPINYERPRVAGLIESAITNTPRNESVLVMGCGPATLMKQVRDTTAACIRSDGPSVELHCEQFGW